MSRSTERILEEAHLSGYLKLNGRKLKEFPSSDKYDLNDTVSADLSRNRFTEIPSEVTRFWCLEHLNFHHNAIKFIPDSITYLQCLVFLDLGHNQLTSIPSSVFHLPLEILLASNNKLQNLPAEIGYCKTLTELDVSCNQINRLPPQLGVLNSLRSFNVRSNMLLEIPIELTYLKLTRLDMSRNRIASLPVELKNMSPTLEILRLSDNPLMSPPAVVCGRGMIHVFKWLEMRCSKQDKKQMNNNQASDIKMGKWKYNDFAKNQVDGHHIDWTYLNIDPTMQMYLVNDDKYSKRLDKRSSEPDISYQNDIKHSQSKLSDVPSASKLLPKSQTNDSRPNEKAHPQTYKEYKESLRLQRTVDSIYKCSAKETVNNLKSNIPPSNNIQDVLPVTNDSKSIVSNENKTNQKPIPKVTNVESKEKETKNPKSVENAEKPIALICNVKNGVTRTKSKTLHDNPFGRCQFTMRREYEKAKEEAELIKQLRTTIETRLKVVLPNDLPTALSDGVVLCHFANHIMPQSVGSIHVPSPTVPKLTTARSRRNVDSFLEACRKIGIDEELLCNGSAILEMKEDYLPTVAVIVQNFLSKSDEHNLSTREHEHIYNETLAQIHTSVASSLSPPHPMSDHKSTALFLTLVCGPSDILEGKGLAQIAVTVAELLRFYNAKTGLAE